MKNGLTLRGPDFSRSTAVSAMALRPPMPEPISTPVRCCCSSVSAFQPESSTAWTAAVMP
jgi:hypothetical protein